MTSHVTVVLVRHGEATSTDENPERPLTVAGRQHAERVASWLDTAGVEVEAVVHSPKLRARQTAKIFGQRLGVHAARVRERADLRPHDDPRPVADDLELDQTSLVIVGHLPFLARLASQLLVGDPDSLRIRFLDAGAVVLGRVGEGWQLEAVAGHDQV